MPFPNNPVQGLLHRAGYTGLLNAVNYVVTQWYGCTDFKGEPLNAACTKKNPLKPRFHSGVDIANRRCGDPVHTVADGKVIIAGIPSWNLGAVLVAIQHTLGGANPYRTWYAHEQLKLDVKVGDVVKTGQTIGRIGTTGMSTGCHLHFQVKRRSNAGKYYNVDPRPLLTIVP